MLRLAKWRQKHDCIRDCRVARERSAFMSGGSPAQATPALVPHSGNNLVKTAARILAALLLCCGLTTACPAVATATPLQLPPQNCKLGAFVQSLHDFKFQDKTFQADIWLWANCSGQQYEPLLHLWLLNADTCALTKYYKENEADGSNWSYILLTGKFRHNWDVKNYPFDRHELIVDVEDADTPADQLGYSADPSESVASEHIELDTYKIVEMTVRADIQSYHTSFGNPHLSEGIWRAPRFTVHLFLKHKGYLRFFNMIIPVFAAFMIALLTFFLNMDTPPAMAGRLGMLGTGLFAVVLNLRAVSDVLGNVDDITLLDKIHILCFVFIVVALLVTVRSWQLHHAKADARRVRRLNYWSAAVLGLTYLLANAALVLGAALTG
jgi:hypothetical protein